MRAAVKTALLPVMQATPQGASMQHYADLIGYSREECSKAARMLHDAGRVCWLQNGMHKHWTAREHAATMAARVDVETAQRKRDRAAKDLEYKRQPQVANRRNAAERARGRKRKPKNPQRYPWPQVVVYTEPKRPIPSVWELACAC